MKKILAVILCLTFVLAAFGSMAVLAEEAEAPVEGFVQDDDKKEFRASTADGLMKIAEKVNGGGFSDYNIFIDADIDMGGKVWKPIAATTGNIYCGTVDGQNHTITGLSVQEYAASVGFIGFARPGTVIKNLHLRGVNFSSTSAYNGGLIGRIDGARFVGDYVLITGCTVEGRISTDKNYAGGLVGCFFDGIGSGEKMKDEEGNDTTKDLFYSPNLVVENCAVNMVLSADMNYACGIMGGDSFRKEAQTLPGDSATITCKNVFVTGTYKSPAQASGFIGYMNLSTLVMENCFSAAVIQGNTTQSGSFFTRTRKSNITVRNCYSICDLPISGEIENFGTMYDAEGNTIDGMTIINSYAMTPEILDENGVGTGRYEDAKVCLKLTVNPKPTEPAEGATAEEIAAYEEALAFYNNLVIVNLNAQNYGIEDVAGVDEDGKQVIKLTVPSKHKQALLSDAERIVPTLFAAGSKQLEVFNAYMKAAKCEHENARELAASQYIAANATCTAKAQYFKSCADCNIALEDTFESGEFAPHTYADRWGYDETNHYHACSVCREATTGEEAHTFGAWEVKKQASTTKEGEEERECPTCGATETRSIPKLAPVVDTPVEEEEEGGCGSVIGGATIIVMLAAAGAVVLRKKED